MFGLSERLVGCRDEGIGLGLQLGSAALLDLRRVELPHLGGQVGAFGYGLPVARPRALEG
jgi:hypothetical protein